MLALGLVAEIFGASEGGGYLISRRLVLTARHTGHPGSFVNHEILKLHGLSVTDAAEVLGVTRPALSALLNDRAHLSPEMALRIEKAFGVSIETLMRMQNSYDISQARQAGRGDQGRTIHGQAAQSTATFDLSGSP